MPAAINCQSIVTPDGSLTPGAVVIGDDGRILEAGRVPHIPEGAQVIHLPDAALVPGFIDLHVHGGGGFSLATRDTEEIRDYARWVVSRGVTSFLPTLCAGSIDEGLEFIRTAAGATGKVEGGASVLGINLEGPFVNPDRRGALPKGWPRGEDIPSAEIALLKLLIEESKGTLRIMTLAPEMTDYWRFIETLTGAGVVASFGHTNMTYEQAQVAFAAGASHVTHLLNAMRPFHHREPGILGAAFDDRDVTVEVIADGIHLHAATVAMIIHMFGPDRVALISDAVPPAASDSRTFRLGDDEATRWGDRVLLKDGTIAGGTETMDHIVRNVVWWQDTELAGAACMASTVPARVLGLDDRKGRIAPGYDADLVALDTDLNVAMTWVQGRVVYSRSAGAIS